MSLLVFLTEIFPFSISFIFPVILLNDRQPCLHTCNLNIIYTIKTLWYYLVLLHGTIMEIEYGYVHYVETFHKQLPKH